MKTSHTSNEMIQIVAHFDVSKIYEIWKNNTLIFLQAKKHIQLCLAPLETPHCGTSLYIMTLVDTSFISTKKSNVSKWSSAYKAKMC